MSGEARGMEDALANLPVPIRFSATLEAAIKEVVPATDEFDDPDFDPTAYINKKFPTEESLPEVEPHLKEINAKIKKLGTNGWTVRHGTVAGTSSRHQCWPRLGRHRRFAAVVL